MALETNRLFDYNRFNKETIFAFPHQQIQEVVERIISDDNEGREMSLLLMARIDTDFINRIDNRWILKVAKELFKVEELRTILFPDDTVASEERIEAFLFNGKNKPEYVILLIQYILLCIKGLIQKKLETPSKKPLFDHINEKTADNITNKISYYETIISQDERQQKLPEGDREKLGELYSCVDIHDLKARIYKDVMDLPCNRLCIQSIQLFAGNNAKSRMVQIITGLNDRPDIEAKIKALFLKIKTVKERLAKQKETTLRLKLETENEARALFNQPGSVYMQVGPEIIDPALEIDPAKITARGKPVGSRRAKPIVARISLDKLAVEVPKDQVGKQKRVPTLQGMPPAVDPIPEAVRLAGDSDWEADEVTQEHVVPLASQRGSIRRLREAAEDSVSETSGNIGQEAAEVQTADPETSVVAVDEVTSESVHIPLPPLPVAPGIIEEGVDVELEHKLSLEQRIANIRGVVKSHPGTVIGGTAAALTVVLGTHFLTRPNQPAKEYPVIKKPRIVQKLPDASVESMQARRIPREVMQADMDVMGASPVTETSPKPKEYKPVKTTVNIDLSPKYEDSKHLVGTKLSSLLNIPEGDLRNMFAGVSFNVQNAKDGSITGFMEQVLLKNAKTPEQRKAYYKMLKDLENGWLLYMQKQEEELKIKAEKGALTFKEKEQLEYWKEYKKTHLERGFDAKFLYKKLNKLKEGTVEYKYYKDLLDKGTALMQGLEEINPEILNVNNPGSQQVYFARAEKTRKTYVLKTLFDFASGMRLPVPERALGTTGDLTPVKPAQPEQTVAENASNNSASIQSSIDKTLDKILKQIDENNHQRELQKRNSWVVGEVSKAASGEIENLKQPKMTKEQTIPSIILSQDISPVEQSGTIISSGNILRAQRGVIEKPTVKSGVITTSESNDRHSKIASGIIEKPKKSFFGNLKEKAKSAWNKLFG